MVTLYSIMNIFNLGVYSHINMHTSQMVNTKAHRDLCHEAFMTSRGAETSGFIKNILICVLKINQSRTSLKQFKGD